MCCCEFTFFKSTLKCDRILPFTCVTRCVYCHSQIYALVNLLLFIQVIASRNGWLPGSNPQVLEAIFLIWIFAKSRLFRLHCLQIWECSSRQTLIIFFAEDRCCRGSTRRPRESFWDAVQFQLQFCHCSDDAHFYHQPPGKFKNYSRSS